MAIIRPIHGPMSGSIAGNTWSRNRGGMYVRSRTTPINPSSIRQQLARTRLSTYSGDWRTLGETLHAQWTEWAALHPVMNALGESIILTGQQAFVGLSSRAFLTGGAAPTSAPVDAVPDSLTLLSGAGTAGTKKIVLTFTPTPLAATLRVMVYETIPGSAGRYPNQAQARYGGVLPLASASLEEYTSRFSPLATEVSVIYCSVVAPDGQASPPLRARVVWA